MKILTSSATLKSRIDMMSSHGVNAAAGCLNIVTLKYNLLKHYTAITWIINKNSNNMNVFSLYYCRFTERRVAAVSNQTE